MKAGATRGSVVSGLLAASAVLLFLLPDAPESLLLRQSAVAQGELWRLLLAHLVHLNAWHLVQNLAGLLLLNEVLLRHLRLRDLAWLALWCALFLSLALLLFLPAGMAYGGLSGVLHGLASGGLMLMLLDTRLPDRRRLPLVVALVALAAKVMWEAVAGSWVPAGLIGGPIITWSHAAGAASGLVVANIRARLLLRFSRFGLAGAPALD